MMDLRPGVLKHHVTGEWEHPNADEVRAVIAEAELTGAQVAALTGVTARNVRRYVSGEYKVPFALWWQLLEYIGLADPVRKGDEV